MQGILLLVYVSALMFVGRHFAGPIVARISSIGLMFVSCLAAGIGLYLLSMASSPLLAFAAATVWGLGVCWMWPTMLAIVAERYPRGGAMAMGSYGFCRRHVYSVCAADDGQYFLTQLKRKRLAAQISSRHSRPMRCRKRFAMRR